MCFRCLPETASHRPRRHAKIRKTWELIRRHRHERDYYFYCKNETAYRLGELPDAGNHHLTKAAERKEMLDRFRSGDYPVLITSKVLNEGVDVPEAGVGIIVSGSGSIREHVQRLDVFYGLVTAKSGFI